MNPAATPVPVAVRPAVGGIGNPDAGVREALPACPEVFRPDPDDVSTRLTTNDKEKH